MFGRASAMKRCSPAGLKEMLVLIGQGIGESVVVVVVVVVDQDRE